MSTNSDTQPEAARDHGADPGARREPIAIIGAGIRFPGSNESLDQFAAFLTRGGNGIRPVPEERWDVEAFQSDGPDAKGKIRAAGFGFLDQIDQFDAPFFGISPLEAQYVDPQQRMLLEVTWEALESANLDPAALRHSSGGAYVGASSFDYALELDSLSYEEVDGHLAAGISFFPMAGRLSYFLGWRGPSLSTDTACASSLTALHLAVEGLRGGECPIAVAAAVCAIHHPKIPVMFTHGNMLAPDGQCKTFDDSADGYVRAEGCGALVLKRLSDAQRDGDPILALIRSTAIGQDGESAGLTVPNGNAQEAVMRAALRNAGLTPGDIQYVEAHGTGTALGDPIEMGAITDVFGAHHTKDAPLVVSSVKTNVGHMEPVAGIGGVVKSVLQMREKSFFPHLNMTKPSGRIPWDRIPVHVPTEGGPWQAPVRRALVNSFGFGGAIASAVLEEAPPVTVEPPVELPGNHIVVVSAKSRQSLTQLLSRYREHLAAHPETRLDELCYTAAVGRSHFPLRAAGVVRDREQLDAFLAKQIERTGKATPTEKIRKVAFLFTGQGSQYPGMGKALYRQFPVFREHLDACDRLFAPELGRSVVGLMFGPESSAEDLQQTRYTQAALFSLEYALAQLWLSWGIRPNVLIGHSIGEVAAASVAGLFSLPDAVRLVAARGRLMQAVAAPGGMAAVNCAAEELTDLLAGRDDLAVASINSPSQTVISGAADALAEVTAALTAQSRKVTNLAVSHAFHSPLMREVFDEFRAALTDIEFHEPSMTVVSNLTGKPARLSELVDPEYWVRHIGEPVNFLAGMRSVERRGNHNFVEIGPSNALMGLARQCLTPEHHRWLASLDRRDEHGDVIRESVAALYRAGATISWTGFHAGRERGKINLPTYPFDRKRYWLPIKGPRHGLGGASGDGTVHHPLLGAETEGGDGMREFRARWSATSPGYLADHVVMGRVVFPGTGYLEVLLALQDAVLGQTGHEIRDVQIAEPLFLGDEPVQVRIRFRPATEDGENHSAEITSHADGVERVHMRAGIARHPSHAPTETGAALRELAAAVGEPDEVLGEDAVYAAYAAAGLEYGPRFRRTQKAARHGTDLAVGEVRGVRAGAVEHVPPYLTDSATHAYAAIGDDGNSYLPVSYAAFTMFKKPKADALRVLMRIDPTPAAGLDRSIDLLALEADQPVFELRGLGMKRVQNTAGGRRRGIAHQQRWLKRSLPPTAAPQPHTVLLVGAPGPVASGLGEQAVESARVVTAADAAEAAGMVAAGGITDVCWFWRSAGQTGTPTGDAAVASLRAECEANYTALLDLIRSLGDAGFGRQQRLWLVTEGAQLLPGDATADDRPVAAASLWGAGHTLLNEHPSYRTTLVDLPGDRTGYRQLLEEIAASVGGEFQVAYRAGHRHVRRLLPLPLSTGADPEENMAVTIREYGQFGNLQVIPAPVVAPEGDQVEVLVRAAGLNFKDVLNALGMLRAYGEQPLGFEAAGTVVAAGPDATHQVGDEVIVNYLGCMQRRIVVPSAVAVRKPPNLSMREAAGVAAVYVTAHYALHTLADIKAGDRVLIHAAAGGVGQAAVQLAKAAGAEVYATASPHKWQVLTAQGVRHVMNSRTLDFADELMRVTDGAGVDIVLNSLNKDYIPVSMSCLAPGGRFIEMGKVGAWTPEQAGEVRPDLRYHNFDLSELPWDDAVRVTGETLRIIADRLAAGVLSPIRTTIYTLDELEEAFGVLSRGQNIGKLVVDFAPEPARPEIPIRPDRTYVVTGGLGALGLVTANELVAAGARHIALIGRSGAPTPDVAELVERLRATAEVTVHRGDVAEPADLTRVLAEIGRRPHPIGGIVHSAGMLRDAPVAAQTWESIDEVFRPKVYGTWLLHQAARDLPELAFLIGYSSAAPIVGTPGQLNYSAANAFLDDLLLRRFAAGQGAFTINWGPWGEVGMSARLSDQLIKRWADEGIVLTTPAVGMRALRQLLRTPTGQAVVGECDWDRFIAAKPVANALYQRLRDDTGDAAADGLDVAALLAAPSEQRRASIDQYVRAKVAAVLHFDDVDAVDSTVEFVRLGLDSLVGVELKNSLESAFGVPLPASVALQYPTAEALAEYLDGLLTTEATA